jgi:hypothetical protein
LASVIVTSVTNIWSPLGACVLQVTGCSACCVVLCVFFTNAFVLVGARGSVVVEALCYKPEGRGIASRRGGFFSNLPNPSGRSMALGLTQPLT